MRRVLQLSPGPSASAAHHCCSCEAVADLLLSKDSIITFITKQTSRNKQFLTVKLVTNCSRGIQTCCPGPPHVLYLLYHYFYFSTEYRHSAYCSILLYCCTAAVTCNGFYTGRSHVIYVYFHAAVLLLLLKENIYNTVLLLVRVYFCVLVLLTTCCCCHTDTVINRLH